MNKINVKKCQHRHQEIKALPGLMREQRCLYCNILLASWHLSRQDMCFILNDSKEENK